jgi:hypothetical protein
MTSKSKKSNIIDFPTPKPPKEVVLRMHINFDEDTNIFTMRYEREPPTLSDYNVAGLIVMILQQLAEDDPQIRNDFMQ